MNKKKATRMTLEDLINAKLKREQDKLVVKEIEIPSLGKTLLFRRPTREEICSFMDQMGQDTETEELIEGYQELIYNCCDQLHDKEVIENMGVENPVMVVPAIMDDADILKVGDEVAKLNPLYGTYADEEKNS